MILPTWNDYLLSRKPATNQGSQVSNTIAIKPSNVRTLIESEQVAALGVLSSDTKLTALYHPLVLPSVDGSPPSAYCGNMFSTPFIVGPATIDLNNGTRFVGILNEEEVNEFDIEKTTAIPQALVEAHSLGDGNLFLVSSPKVLLTHFHQELSTGKLQDQQQQVEKNGAGAVVWLTLLKSANTPEKRNAIRSIMDDPTIKNNLAQYVAFGVDEVDPDGPVVPVDLDPLNGHEPQLRKLQVAFGSPGSSPHPVSPFSGSAQLTTNQDKYEIKKGAQGRNALVLPTVGATIVDNVVVAASAVRPTHTVAFNNLVGAPNSEMTDNFANSVANYLRVNKLVEGATDLTQLCTLEYVPTVVIKNIVQGKWPTDLSVNFQAETQLLCLNLLAFRQQSPTNSLLRTIAKDEESARHHEGLGGTGLSKTLREFLSRLESIEDDTAVAALVNTIHILSILVDFEEMKKNGKPSVYETIAMILVKKFNHWAKIMFPSWRARANFHGKHLGALLFTWAERFLVACGLFATDLHNQEVFGKENGDVTTLNYKHLNDFMKDFDAFVLDIEGRERTMIPHKEPPALFIAYAKGKDPAPADEASRQPAAERSGRASRDNEDRGTRRTNPDRDQDGDRGDQGSGRKKQKQSSPTGAIDPLDNGIVILRDGESLNDAFPANFKACKKHVTRGHRCTARNCGNEHWNNLSEATNFEAKKWGEHVRANSKVCWFNKWRIGDYKDQSLFKDICGPVNSPPAPRERLTASRDSAVLPRQVDSPSPREESHPRHNITRFFSAPKPQTLTTRSNPWPRAQPLAPFPAAPSSNDPMSNRVSSATDSTGPSTTEAQKKLVRSGVHANNILQTYSEQYGGTDAAPIVTTLQGKNRKRKRKIMPDRLTATYRAEPLIFDNVVLPLLASGYLSRSELGRLEVLSQRFSRVIPNCLRLEDIDSTPLQLPRLNYANQQNIDRHRVDMASAQFIRCGGDPALLVRYCAQEHILEHLDREGILNRVKDIAPPEDYRHLERILFDGCPAELNFDENAESRKKTFTRGNQPTYLRNPDKTKKALNKEDKHSFVIPIDEDLAFLSPYCRHTPQGAIDKLGKSFRIVWDGSTKSEHDDEVMNEVTPTDNEPQVTFGNVEKLFNIDLYELRVSYPHETIYLAFADVTSCYKFPRIHPRLSGAFGYLDGFGQYNVANAMVFGSNVSAMQWEPFRRLIEILSKLFQDRDDLVEKYEKYLKMIKWDDDVPPPNVKAKGCKLRPGVVDADGNHVPRPARMYVDDALAAEAAKIRMKKKLAAIIEAIFCLMGFPDEEKRRCPLSLDKWEGMTVGPYQTLLGLFYDTVNLTRGTTPEFRAELLAYLHEFWPLSRTTFTAHEMQVLVGKLARLAKGAPWVFHMLSHAYDQIALALASNHRMLSHHSDKFKGLISCIKRSDMGRSKLTQDVGRLVAFALKRASQMVHRSRCTYQISDLLREDIEFFRRALSPNSGIPWWSQLAHIVERTPIGIPVGDSCLRSCGGYCVELRYWWYIAFPEHIVKRTLIHLKDDSSGKLISINALEFITVIINYCAALSVIAADGLFSDDQYPVVLCKTDNTSALNWVSHRCKGSPLGRALGRLFVGLLMDSPLGINAEWLSTHDNEVADEVREDAGDMSTLVTVFTASLANLQRINNEAKSASKGTQELQTRRSREAFWIAWCEANNITHPVGNDPEYAELLGMYLHDVRLGNNYHNKKNIRSATLRGYAEAVNELFRLRGMPLPYDPSNKRNDSTVAIANLADEETIANQREPLTEPMAAEAIRIGQQADRNSVDSLVANIICLARFVGPRLSEYACNQQKKVTYHTFRSGTQHGSKRKIVRPWIAEDFRFYDSRGVEIHVLRQPTGEVLTCYQDIHHMKLKWRIQKNRRNGQTIKLPADKSNRTLCPVYNALQIIARKIRLDPTQLDTPVCVYVNKNSTIPLYLTGAKVKDLLQRAIDVVNPNMPPEERQKYSAHSLRVWACVLLDQAKKSPSFIKQRLRWLGESYRLYLRDTLHQSQSHQTALADNTNEILLVLSANANTYISAIGTPDGGTDCDSSEPELQDEED